MIIAIGRSTITGPTRYRQRNYDIANIHLSGDTESFRSAVASQVESYQIFANIDRLGGSAAVESILGQVFGAIGRKDETREFLQASLDGYRKRGCARSGAG